MSVAPAADIQRLTFALRMLRRKLDVPGLPDALNVDARCLLDIADDAAGHLAGPMQGEEEKHTLDQVATVAAIGGNVIPFAPRRV